MLTSIRIAEHWQRQGRWVEDLSEPGCFACKLRVEGWNRLERAHIVADSIGGRAVASNLVLLCKACHREAPMTANSEFLFRWIDTRDHYIVATFKAIQAEFVRLGGRIHDSELLRGIKGEELERVIAAVYEDLKIDHHPNASPSFVNPTGAAIALLELLKQAARWRPVFATV